MPTKLTDEQRVRAAVPDASIRGHRGKVWIFSPSVSDSYTLQGMMSKVCYLGTREDRRAEAWKDARENSPTVQAYEKAQEAAHG